MLSTGGFDAEQLNEPGDAMCFRALDQKIGGGFFGSKNFWMNAVIRWMQRMFGQLWSVLPHFGIKTIGTARIDGVIDRLNPLHIGAKVKLSGCYIGITQC